MAVTTNFIELICYKFQFLEAGFLLHFPQLKPLAIAAYFQKHFYLNKLHKAKKSIGPFHINGLCQLFSLVFSYVF